MLLVPVNGASVPTLYALEVTQSGTCRDLLHATALAAGLTLPEEARPEEV